MRAHYGYLAWRVVQLVAGGCSLIFLAGVAAALRLPPPGAIPGSTVCVACGAKVDVWRPA